MIHDYATLYNMRIEETPALARILRFTPLLKFGARYLDLEHL